MTTTADELRDKRDVIAPLWEELAWAEREAGSKTAVYDEILPKLDLRQPPPALREGGFLLQICESALCPGGYWRPEEHPLGLASLRELAIIRFLRLVSAALTDFQEALI